MNIPNSRPLGGCETPCLQPAEGGPLYPAYVRLPKPPARCPVSSICRSTMISLISGAAPLVKSKVLKQPGAKRGIRLVDTASLLTYLDSLPDSEETLNKEGACHE